MGDTATLICFKGSAQIHEKDHKCDKENIIFSAAVFFKNAPFPRNVFYCVQAFIVMLSGVRAIGFFQWQFIIHAGDIYSYWIITVLMQ